jgi:hypothetical protein
VEEQLIPARITSTTGFSNDVINVTQATSNVIYYGGSGKSSDLHVVIERNQPPLVRVVVSEQTSLGIYTIPLIVTIREPSIATQTKPISVDSRGGTVDPEFELSKKYPTVGYLTRPVNFTVTVIASMTISDQFKNFLGRVRTVRAGHGDHRWRARKNITHYAGCNFKTYHRS